MKVAIVHDWLVTYAGAERVLEQMLCCYPDADLFSMVDFLDKDKRDFILNKPVKTSLIQKLPGAKKYYRSYLPLMPLCIEQFDLSSYDLILSSSHAVAKGVITGPRQLHICLCHSPIRYGWDLTHEYLNESGLNRGVKSWIVRIILHYMRLWDTVSANRVDEFIAVSEFISRRIKKIYRRNSQVVYSPVDISFFEFQPNKSDFYLTASRMVPYKSIPLIIQAFSTMPDKKLVVIGDGPEFGKCQELASNNVEILGWQSDDILKNYMQKAKAFIFAAEEDFGIIPLEAQSCGTPVIAYGRGGVVETIIPWPSPSSTGIFFDEKSVSSLSEAIVKFEKILPEINNMACRKNAEKYSNDRFRREFFDTVENLYSNFTQPFNYRA